MFFAFFWKILRAAPETFCCNKLEWHLRFSYQWLCILALRNTEMWSSNLFRKKCSVMEFVIV